MSGSSGGGNGGGFDPTPVDCGELSFETQLSSPKPDVVARLSESDVLEVELRTEGTSTVVVALHQGEIAGGLASPLISNLRECISEGFDYVAHVTEQNAGQVRVRVEPK